MTEILAALGGAAVVLAGTVATGIFNLKSVSRKADADLSVERERLSHARDLDRTERLSAAARNFYRDWTAAVQLAEAAAQSSGVLDVSAWIEGVGPTSADSEEYRTHRAGAHAWAAELTVLSPEVGKAAVRLLNEQPVFYEVGTQNYFDALRTALSSK